MIYSHILVATAFSEKCQHTLEHAKQLAQHHQAKLSFVHFVEPLPASAFVYSGAIDLDKKRIKAAKEKLDEVGEFFDIPAQDRYVTEASPKAGIVKLAKKLKVNLIILSNHGHSAMLHVLGSTAETVAHHAPCDILIIR